MTVALINSNLLIKGKVSTYPFKNHYTVIQFPDYPPPNMKINRSYILDMKQGSSRDAPKKKYLIKLFYLCLMDV